MNVWRNCSPTSSPATGGPWPRTATASAQLSRSATRASFDAVLVSNRLRDMGGVELITRIRALDHRKDVPIVMVTGSTEVAVVAAALAARRG